MQRHILVLIVVPFVILVLSNVAINVFKTEVEVFPLHLYFIKGVVEHVLQEVFMALTVIDQVVYVLLL